MSEGKFSFADGTVLSSQMEYIEVDEWTVCKVAPIRTKDGRYRGYICLYSTQDMDSMSFTSATTEEFATAEEAIRVTQDGLPIAIRKWAELNSLDESAQKPKYAFMINL